MIPIGQLTEVPLACTLTPDAGRELVKVESACCSFVDWRIEDDGSQLRLVVSGSPEHLAALSIG